MAIQKINLGTEPLGEGGDTYRSANTKINENFSNTAHAASRLVGTAKGNVIEVGAFGLGLKNNEGYNSTLSILPEADNVEASKDFIKNTATGFYKAKDAGESFVISSSTPSTTSTAGSFVFMTSGYQRSVPQYTYIVSNSGYVASRDTHTFYTTQNTTKDSNGFLKGKSPVTRLYSDRLEHQGNDKELEQIEFEKLGVGDYLLKNTTGLANEGWYIELPQDANKNPLIAVTYSDDGKGNLSIKTYKRKFDFEAVSIVADTDNPVNIPETRWIDLRFNYLPQEDSGDFPTSEDK